MKVIFSLRLRYFNANFLNVWFKSSRGDYFVVLCFRKVRPKVHHDFSLFFRLMQTKNGLRNSRLTVSKPDFALILLENAHFCSKSIKNTHSALVDKSAYFYVLIRLKKGIWTISLKSHKLRFYWGFLHFFIVILHLLKNIFPNLD